MTSRTNRFESLLARYRRVAVAVLNCLALLIVINLGLWVAYSTLDWSRRLPRGRTSDYRRYSSDLLDAAYPGWDPQERDALLWETRTRPFRCNPFTHYIESPFNGRYVNVDEAGFRWNRTQLPWPPPKDSMVVFVFGGSTTFGYGVPDSETVPSYLQEFLSESAGVGPPVYVYNFGQGSFFSTQEMILFSSLLRAGYVPNAAVFVDGWNEWGHSDWPSNIGICSREPQLPSTSIVVDLPMIRLARSLRYRLGLEAEEEGVAGSSDPSAALVEAVVARWPRTVAQTRAVAEQFGVAPLFVWQPVSVYNYDLKNHIFANALNVEQREGIRDGYRRMAEVLAPLQEDPHILNLADIQLRDERPLYVDRCHYSAPFGKEIADRIAVRLLSILKAD